VRRSRAARRERGEQLGDHLGVDDQAAVGHAPDTVEELRDVDNALLEQVAGAVGPLGDQAQRVVRLDVLGQRGHADAGVGPGDLGGGL
jgi:hypothetical protein